VDKSVFRQSQAQAMPKPAKSRCRWWSFRLGSIAFGLLIAFVVLEIGIRIFRPFPMLVQGGRLNLPVNAQVNISHHGFPGIDDPVEIRFNSLGFRGPELPKQRDTIKIICVGGSTTQCLYLSEGKTWPDQLAGRLQHQSRAVWVNNAGIDGHSTFGHLLLVAHVRSLQPDYLIFYVGINDVERVDLNDYDRAAIRSLGEGDAGFGKSFYLSLIGRSELVAVFDVLRRHHMAKRRGLSHRSSVDHSGLENVELLQLTDEARRERLGSLNRSALNAFRQRLNELVRQTHAMGAIPILVTQPALFGGGIDPITGIDLCKVRMGEEDGFVAWSKLEAYNEITRTVGHESKSLVIDMARELPKSSEYFYDLIHNNNAGASLIADLMAPHLMDKIGAKGGF
jgi:lysophospholipase L1-like esterase